MYPNYQIKEKSQIEPGELCLGLRGNQARFVLATTRSEGVRQIPSFIELDAKENNIDAEVIDLPNGGPAIDVEELFSIGKNWSIELDFSEGSINRLVGNPDLSGAHGALAINRHGTFLICHSDFGPQVAAYDLNDFSLGQARKFSGAQGYLFKKWNLFVPGPEGESRRQLF